VGGGGGGGGGGGVGSPSFRSSSWGGDFLLFKEKFGIEEKLPPREGKSGLRNQGSIIPISICWFWNHGEGLRDLQKHVKGEITDRYKKREACITNKVCGRS